MNINEITEKYDNLLAEQKKTLRTMNKLILLSEILLHDLQIINGGNQNATKSQNT